MSHLTPDLQSSGYASPSTNDWSETSYFDSPTRVSLFPSGHGICRTVSPNSDVSTSSRRPSSIRTWENQTKAIGFGVEAIDSSNKKTESTETRGALLRVVNGSTRSLPSQESLASKAREAHSTANSSPIEAVLSMESASTEVQSIIARQSRNTVTQSSKTSRIAQESKQRVERTPTARSWRTMLQYGENKPAQLQPATQRWSLDGPDVKLQGKDRIRGHKKSSSWASSGFVNAVKSVAANAPPLSRTTRRNFRSSEKSSRKSYSFLTAFTDVRAPSINIMDPAAVLRGMHRLNTLEEILSTEESYVADLKVLVNMSRFFIYEEYGAHYESMLRDMTAQSRAIPHWQAYERGIEALANTLAPTTGEGPNKKGLTFGDLLIKPIQRVCRYPLLFGDLLRYTPVIDCPESHAEIDKILHRLRETATEINRVTNDQEARERIKRTWALQDILRFPDDTVAPSALRSLGHPILCGVLHVAYQSKQQGITGLYMICVLYKSFLIFGQTSDGYRPYVIVASISLSELRIEAVDNGKGLQCNTALFSWKIIFESNQQLYEVILSACSAQEETAWKTHLLNLSSVDDEVLMDDSRVPPTASAMLALEMKSIGSILGQPGTLARRISIQRAATVGPRTNVYQVFIKNTHALRDGVDPLGAAYSNVGRSKSLLTTNRIPILAPKRLDRVRMEHDLSKVWTKDQLPYPGMAGTRGEHLIRASASSMMRKLSRASAASGLSKRSVSVTSMPTSRFGDVPDSLRMYGLKAKTNISDLKLGSTVDSNTDLPDLAMSGPYPIIAPTRGGSTDSRFRITRSASEETTTKLRKIQKPEAGKERAGERSLERPLRSRWSTPLSLFRNLSTDRKKN
ncbi:hypothetical protein MMC25_004732 [Agyrium rufum]|nr:hypothetical protein [Agyrium rufum]